MVATMTNDTTNRHASGMYVDLRLGTVDGIVRDQDEAHDEVAAAYGLPAADYARRVCG